MELKPDINFLMYEQSPMKDLTSVTFLARAKPSQLLSLQGQRLFQLLKLRNPKMRPVSEKGYIFRG